MYKHINIYQKLKSSVVRNLLIYLTNKIPALKLPYSYTALVECSTLAHGNIQKKDERVYGREC